jgi:hypothetical protein
MLWVRRVALVEEMKNYNTVFLFGKPESK